jgi:hypothetical protein
LNILFDTTLPLHQSHSKYHIIRSYKYSIHNLVYLQQFFNLERFPAPYNGRWSASPFCCWRHLTQLRFRKFLQSRNFRVPIPGTSVSHCRYMKFHVRLIVSMCRGRENHNLQLHTLFELHIAFTRRKPHTQLQHFESHVVITDTVGQGPDGAAGNRWLCGSADGGQPISSCEA